MKCNVAVGFNTNIGWCYRDCNGRFIMTGISWDVACYFVIEAEALTLEETELGAIQLQMKFVIF